MKHTMPMLQITPIPAFTDNYIWAIHDAKTCIVVDPSAALPVLQFLENHKLMLAGILVTHHHADHTGGIQALLEQFPIPVYGPDNPEIHSVSHSVQDNQTISLAGKHFTVLAVPGHTLDHIAYYLPAEKALFSGDTLFAGGCGRIFEGTPAQMLASLEKLAALPADTRLFCTHEYTVSNLRFALEVEPSSEPLHKRLSGCLELRRAGLPTLPSLLAEELETNPFLRAHKDTVITQALNQGARSAAPLDVFTCLREWKNHF